jgi:hypothetical protein
MGWNDQQNGQFGGNRPNPNNTQANYDYDRGRNEKIAQDNAARAAQTAAAYTPPPAPTYSAPPTYTPPASYTPSPSSATSFTPSTSSSSGSSYSGGGYSRRSMSEEETTQLLYPDVVARRSAEAQEPKKAHKTPWAAIFLGVIVGYGLSILPPVLDHTYYHSPYADKMAFSMATFCAFLFWAIVELTRKRGRVAFATVLLGFFIPELFWFTSGVTFLRAKSSCVATSAR